MNRKNKSAIVKELRVSDNGNYNCSEEEQSAFTLIDARNLFCCKSKWNTPRGYTVLRVIYT